MKSLTLDYQREIFKYLLQNKSSVRLVKDIPIDVFQNTDHRIVLQEIKKFVNKFSRMPSSIDTSQIMYQYIEDNKTKLGITQDQIDLFQQDIKNLYTPVQADEEYLAEHLVTIIQYQQMKKLLSTYAPILDNGMEVWEKLKIELDPILSLSMDEDEARPLPTEIFTDWHNDGRTVVYAIQTFLNGLNRLTAKGGFATPELITILGLPKAFKTGTIINLLVHMAAYYGLNIFLADFENGQTQVRTRVKQTLMQASLMEVINNEYADVLEECLDGWKLNGGSIWVGSYTAFTHTAKDVEMDMRRICKENGYENGFDCIGWDYADIMRPTTKQNSLREDIGRVYHDIIAVHKRQGAFGFTASHTNRSAMGKFEPTMADFSEDWGKAKNAHACFYITQDEDEAKENIARIGVVMQRQGAKSGYFPVQINYETQTLEEIPEEVYQDCMEVDED